MVNFFRTEIKVNEYAFSGSNITIYIFAFLLKEINFGGNLLPYKKLFSFKSRTWPVVQN